MARRKNTSAADGSRSGRGRGRARRRGAAEEARGGRRPGRWELTSAEEIRAYRAQHGLSRSRLAGLLGVSTTSVQNWETGRVASLKVQRLLRALMDAPPPAGPDGASEPVQETCTLLEGRLRATGEIVAAYLRAHDGPGLPFEDLSALVRAVRRALS